MKVPLEWLKEYVAVRLRSDVLAHRLTMAGLEVTSVNRLDGEIIFDIEITPNRADCLSIIGIAREVSAITGERLTLPKFGLGRKHSQARHPHSKIRIQIDERKDCMRYIGRLIDGVKVSASPGWMQKRLLACGLRAINNVVDITNYVLLECGQPLHAFDFDNLRDGTIIVRRARHNEPITTLDGIQRLLTSQTLVISDSKSAVAIAGVMGGLGSEVTNNTRRVLLESALFSPITVRRGARALGLASESSYRFERGVDPAGVETSSLRAAELICKLANGNLISANDVGSKSHKRTVIALNVGRLNNWIGLNVPEMEIRTNLARLSCRVASAGSSGALHVTAPSFRRDLVGPVDLYEEIARLYGYDKIPARIPTARIANTGCAASDYWRVQSLRCLCASLGLSEAISWSLVSGMDLSRLGFSASESVGLKNPLSQDHAYLRPTLLIGLLRAIRRNISQGSSGVRLFEVGGVINRAAARERLSLGIVLYGLWSRDWQNAISCDFFRLKGIIETIITRLCRGSFSVSPDKHKWAEPGNAVTFSIDTRPVGMAGEVAHSITRDLDIELPVWFAELSVDEMLFFARHAHRIEIPSQFPAVKRDISLVVEDQIQFKNVAGVLRETGFPLASSIELIDLYRGTQVPKGKYSLTFSIEYRDPYKTLTAAEVDLVHQKIAKELAHRLGAALR